MPITTWLTEQQFVMYQKVDERDVNEILQIVMKIDRDIYVQQIMIPVRKWFKKREVPYFTIYKRLRGGWEVQVVRVPETVLTTSECLAYLFGYLNGATKKHSNGTNQ